ncbi:hypothetical protein DNH61_17440 [Paenibacillus sambharensis]|uniref:Polysaccharide biosynthesis protein n=1 Tax=Paenibacillus sambharensis TaxID=1803190 RepID=A0A2W1LI62_9BACL|nr:oligosaccharide flippase family protein [Paenibacillus sambharensis]PZD94732.1 hypothetical protein DNH61_17440 [Paenibacillus sambharensis]
MLKLQRVMFPILDAALNGFNYFFHIYVSWHLLDIQYGKLNALIALCTILFTAGVSIQMFTARTLSDGEGIRRESLQAVRTIAGAAAVLYTGLFIGLFPLIGRLTRADGMEITIIALTLITHLFLCIQRGIFQGQRRFLAMNISMYTEAGAKLLVLVLLLQWFTDVFTVLLSIWIGMMASLLHGWMNNRDSRRLWFRKAEASPPWREVSAALLAIVCSQFFFYFFTSFDLMIVNYYLPEQSGSYAVIVRFGQLIVFVGMSLLTVLLPEFAARKQDLGKLFSLLWKCIAFMMLLAFTAILLYQFAAPHVIPALFGERYAVDAQLTMLSAVMYASFTFASLFIYVNIALGRSRHLYYIGAVSALLVVSLQLMHANIAAVMIQETAAFILLDLLLLLDLILYRWKVTRDEREEENASILVLERH